MTTLQKILRKNDLSPLNIFILTIRKQFWNDLDDTLKYPFRFFQMLLFCSGIFMMFFEFPASLLFIFVFSTLNSKYVHYKILQMTGFEPWTSGRWNNHSADWVTTSITFSFLPSRSAILLLQENLHHFHHTARA